MKDIEDQFVIAWWNTGLSPIGRDRATESQLRIACEIVRKLFQDVQVDFLGMGEVTKNDLDEILERIGNPALASFDGAQKERRAQFDTGAIYNHERLSLIDHQTYFVRHGNRILKLANRVDFVFEDDPQPFHFFISHWPSPITPNSESIRRTLAGHLRNYIQELIDQYKGAARLIVMGDLNEEPFHDSVENQLLASRDRDLVRKSPAFLYNPFWRFLGESIPYQAGNIVQSFSGTAYLKSENATKWKTVDQIIVSSIFLGKSDWHLNEKRTWILHITPRCNLENIKDDIFDHFPIVTTIDLINKEKGL